MYICSWNENTSINTVNAAYLYQLICPSKTKLIENTKLQRLYYVAGGNYTSFTNSFPISNPISEISESTN